MVAVFVSLKIRQLAGGLRTSNTMALATVLGAAAGLGLAVLAITLMPRLQTVDADVTRAVLVIVGALVMLGWVFIPIVLFGVDESMQPDRFALLPIPRRSLLAGLLAAALLSAPAITTTVIGLSTATAWSGGPATVLALVGGGLGALTCVVASRTATTALAGVLASRRVRDAISVVAVLLVSSIGLFQLAAARAAAATPRALVDRTVEVLAWTPLGAAWAAPYDAVAGSPWLGVAKLAVAAATVVLLVVAWAVAVRRVLEGGGGVASGGTVRTGRGLGPRWASRLLPASVAGAIAARTLTYTWRDPRQRMGILVPPVIIAVIVVIPRISVDGLPGGVAVLAGPLIGVMVGLIMLNHTAYDGTALWTHLAVGLTGQTDRQGRAIGMLVWAAPVVVVASIAGSVLGGRPELAPAAVGAGVGALLCGLAVGAVTSVVAAYPAPPPGRNPFATSAGSNMMAIVQQLLGGLVIAGLAVPALVMFAIAAFGTVEVGLALLVVGPAYGWILLRVGIRVGGNRLDERGPAIMATITPAR